MKKLYNNLLNFYIEKKFSTKKISWLRFIRVQAHNDMYEYLYRISMTLFIVTFYIGLVLFIDGIFSFMDNFVNLYMIIGTSSLFIGLIIGLLFRFEIDTTLICTKTLSIIYEEFDVLYIKHQMQNAYYNQMIDGYSDDEFMEGIC